MEKRSDFGKVRLLTVKMGSSVVCDRESVSAGRLRAFARQLAELHRRGCRSVVVSSGAVAAGVRKLGLPSRPATLRLRQVCAAAGQVSLMTAWEKALGGFGLKCAQILLTAEDLADRRRFLNARNTLASLVEMGVVPIVNENDTVAVEELKLGENDTLGSLVASLAEADLFVNLTDLDGLHSADPRENPAAPLLTEVGKVDQSVLTMAGDSGGQWGTGGMFTKVRAAGRLAERGVASVVASGLVRDVLLRIVDGEELGTFFKPAAKRGGARKHWLAFAARPKGRLLVDAGAAAALVERGKSLLPGGVCGLEGLFDVGDAVTIVEAVGEAELGVGLVNYSAPEIGRIMGRPSSAIEGTLGYSHSEEIVHRDNLVVFKGVGRPHGAEKLRNKTSKL
ncbi:MAG: glutamate 5-kinase [Deltaproteobacteria bacterium]|jgi:glutamate 5-kinase|nr:glutamate 5-kinase [Deltaproteobacteria bacterium]